MSNHYTYSKNALADLIRMERSDRYTCFKIDRNGDGITGPTLVRDAFLRGDSYKQIAQRFGVTTQAIGDCVRYKTYRNV